MSLRYYFYFFVFFNYLNLISSNNLSIKVDEATREPVKLFIGITNIDKKEYTTLVKILEKSFKWSDQFNVVLKKLPKLNKNLLEILFERGYHFVLLINVDKNSGKIKCRFYDLSDSSKVAEKSFNHSFSINDVYKFADSLWIKLFQEQNSFSSQIAFIRKLNNEAKNSVICICDYDGSNLKAISDPGNYVGLYCGNLTFKNQLFCSEFTRDRVQLISINEMGSKKKILFNLSGTIVGISLLNQNEAIYCRSGDIWKFYYDSEKKKAIHTKLIGNDGKNFYPILLKNGDIIFCSDSKKLWNDLTKRSKKYPGPYICYYKKDSDNYQIFCHGYCLSPSYSQKNNQIVYSKSINGVFQLVIYDLKNNKNQQITFDHANKFDPVWSPCGNYIAFCYQHKNKSQIAVENILTRKRHYITSETNWCSNPAWLSK